MDSVVNVNEKRQRGKIFVALVAALALLIASVYFVASFFSYDYCYSYDFGYDFDYEYYYMLIFGPSNSNIETLISYFVYILTTVALWLSCAVFLVYVLFLFKKKGMNIIPGIAFLLIGAYHAITFIGNIEYYFWLIVQIREVFYYSHLFVGYIDMIVEASLTFCIVVFAILSAISALRGMKNKIFVIIFVALNLLYPIYDMLYLLISENVSWWMEYSLYLYPARYMMRWSAIFCICVAFFVFAILNKTYIKAKKKDGGDVALADAEDIADSSDAETQLISLKAKLDAGILSEEEYNAKRNQIIGTL